MSAYYSHIVMAQSVPNGTTSVTLPGVADMYHYITCIILENLASANQAATAEPVQFTTTNIPGNPTFPITTVATLTQTGAVNSKVVSFQSPVRSQNIGANTTIVSPAARANTIWKITVVYYVSP